MRGCLAAILSAAALASCDVAVGPTTPPASTGGGGATAQVVIVGTWRRTVVLQTTDDVLSSETTWLFASDGHCERTLVTHSVKTDITDTTHVFCTYTLSGTNVTIQYTGTGGAATFTVAVQGSTLLLDGEAFSQVA